MYYKPSEPRTVREGIKARSSRGDIGSTWWSGRWREIVEGYGASWTSNRLARGKKYARMGQVMDFSVGIGLITAKVQGSMRLPYFITITVKTIGEEQWSQVVKHMSEKALYAAKLLAGEMPETVEKSASGYGISIFPSKSEFLPACTCPDIAVPCKHIAAVCYIMAEELDKDPFLLFKLRGMDKNELMGRINKTRKLAAYGTAVRPERFMRTTIATTANDSKKKKADIHKFWEIPDFSCLSYSMDVPLVHAAVIKRLGEPGFWRAPVNFVSLMESIYGKISNTIARNSSLERAHQKCQIRSENDPDKI